MYRPKSLQIYRLGLGQVMTRKRKFNDNLPNLWPVSGLFVGVGMRVDEKVGRYKHQPRISCEQNSSILIQFFPHTFTENIDTIGCTGYSKKVMKGREPVSSKMGSHQIIGMLSNFHKQMECEDSNSS